MDFSNMRIPGRFGQGGSGRNAAAAGCLPKRRWDEDKLDGEADTEHMFHAAHEWGSAA